MKQPTSASSKDTPWVLGLCVRTFYSVFLSWSNLGTLGCCRCCKLVKGRHTCCTASHQHSTELKTKEQPAVLTKRKEKKHALHLGKKRHLLNHQMMSEKPRTRGCTALTVGVFSWEISLRFSSVMKQICQCDAQTGILIWKSKMVSDMLSPFLSTVPRSFHTWMSENLHIHDGV